MSFIFFLEPKHASITTEDGMDTLFDHAVSRVDFLAEFSDVDFSTARQISYETARPLYHIIEMDYSVTDLGADPTSDPRMSYIHENINAILSWFEAEYAKEQEESLKVY